MIGDCGNSLDEYLGRILVSAADNVTDFSPADARGFDAVANGLVRSWLAVRQRRAQRTYDNERPACQCTGVQDFASKMVLDVLGILDMMTWTNDQYRAWRAEASAGVACECLWLCQCG